MSTKYLGYKEREVLQDSIKGVEAAMADPIASKALRRKQKLLDSYKREKKILEAKSPPPIADNDRAAAEQRLIAMEQAMIFGNSHVDPMPSRRDMEERPAGAQGQHSRWEQYWKFHSLTPDGKDVEFRKDGYGAIFEWKDGRGRLFADREGLDPDVRNCEIFRPDRPVKDRMMNYQSYTHAPGENLSFEAYNEATGHEPNAMEQKLYAPKHTRPVDEIRRCKGRSKVGNRPCKGWAVKGSNYCIFHQEETDG